MSHFDVTIFQFFFLFFSCSCSCTEYSEILILAGSLTVLHKIRLKNFIWKIDEVLPPLPLWIGLFWISRTSASMTIWQGLGDMLNSILYLAWLDAICPEGLQSVLGIRSTRKLLHASFTEGRGQMQLCLYEAALNGAVSIADKCIAASCQMLFSGENKIYFECD